MNQLLQLRKVPRLHIHCARGWAEGVRAANPVLVSLVPAAPSLAGKNQLQNDPEKIKAHFKYKKKRRETHPAHLHRPVDGRGWDWWEQLRASSLQAAGEWVEGKDFFRSVLFSGCLSALLHFPGSLPHYPSPGRMFTSTPGKDVCRSACSPALHRHCSGTRAGSTGLRTGVCTGDISSDHNKS